MDIGVLANLPRELHYLIEPAIKYGQQNARERCDFLQNAQPEDREELARVANHYRTSEHHDAVGDFEPSQVGVGLEIGVGKGAFDNDVRRCWTSTRITARTRRAIRTTDRRRA